MAKKNLSSVRPRGRFDSGEWYVPCKFLDNDNSVVDSKEVLEQSGFVIKELARDKRFYIVVPPEHWSMRASGNETIEYYDDHSDCIFVQQLVGSFFDKGQIYLKYAEG